MAPCTVGQSTHVCAVWMVEKVQKWVGERERGRENDGSDGAKD